MKTAEGAVDYSAPQVRDTPEPFVSRVRAALSGRTQELERLAVELYARGLSTRDIEDTFTDETGQRLLSRAAVSEVTERLWAEYEDFCKRDLSEHGVVYLFVDGIAERLRPGQRREAVLAAWGIGEDGRKVLLGADGRLEGGRRDGARLLPGHARPRARRSAARRLRRRAGDHPGDRGMLSAVGAPALPGAPHAQPRGQGSDRPVAGVQGARHRLLSGAVARDRACNWRAGIRADYADLLPSALACFEDDFEACIAHLRLPVTHRRLIRTTNLLERLFVEERRRLKIIPNGFGEKPVLKLMFGALIRAAERWRGLRFSEFELRQLAAVRKELDEEYQTAITPPARSSQPRVSSKSAP